jgi:FkbH-like protein
LGCGRFARGIQKGRIGNIRLATINFRKWGKLFGIGPAGLVPSNQAGRLERLNDLVSGAIMSFVPSVALRRVEWEADQWNARRSRGRSVKADAFIIEAWLPDRYPGFSFTLTVVPRNEVDVGQFQARFELCAGYNRLIVPVAEIAARVDLSKPYSIQIEPFEDSIGRDITFGLTEFVALRYGTDQVRAPSRTETRVAAPPATSKAKCVVWDLDNTVWRGTLAEDGPESLVLNPAAKTAIEELDRRGILNSIASKNDPAPALAALEAFGLKDYFLYPQIGWTPKSAAIQLIGASLDIGLDTFVFLDDQAFERGEVRERLPQVTVLSDADLPALLEHPLFDVPVTAESASRRSMYLAEHRRKITFESSAGDYVEFLRGCSIRVDVAKLSAATLERAYELSQRTNQLNVSGRRYSRKELMSLLVPDAGAVVYMFGCCDRFGEYGTIAMCVLNRQRADVESFMMSCRVQKKLVENAIFSWLAGKCAAAGFDNLGVMYRKTQRNDASIRMLEELGFSYAPSSAEAGVFVRPTGTPITDADVVSVHDHTRADEGVDAA